ncbi:hypothetical protein Bbelb_255820 [Branchiostoma belcheri]|nr:hypothetical protein Bbelb_255820 [Branchiostoma belcheri]
MEHETKLLQPSRVPRPPFPRSPKRPSLGSLQPASGFFNYEVDEMLGQERQGKVQVSRSNPDVVTEAGLGVGQLGQRRLCPPGSFRLSTMETCMPWLGCKEITDEVTTLHKIGSGFVKKVYKAIWRNHTVAYSKLTKMAPVKLEYFSRDIKMLKTLQTPFCFAVCGIMQHNSPYRVSSIWICKLHSGNPEVKRI